MNEECIENKRSYNKVHALEFLNEDRTSIFFLPHIIINEIGPTTEMCNAHRIWFGVSDFFFFKKIEDM